MSLHHAQLRLPATLLAPAVDADDRQLRALRDTWAFGVQCLADHLRYCGRADHQLEDALTGALCRADQAAKPLGLPLMAVQTLTYQAQSYALLALAEQREAALEVLWQALEAHRRLHDERDLQQLSSWR